MQSLRLSAVKDFYAITDRRSCVGRRIMQRLNIQKFLFFFKKKLEMHMDKISGIPFIASSKWIVLLLRNVVKDPRG